ncbi:MAG: hypothetical protein ACH350_07895 [Parachlamydiaceae bacterium]
MHTVEKFYKKDAKNGGFSKSMKFPKKSIEVFWANFKKKVRLTLDRVETLAEAIDFSFLSFL